MEHWRLAYLGTRRIPRDLSEFELATFFTFSAKEQALINARRGPLYRLALALHIGFLRMTGTTLDAYQYVPQMLDPRQLSVGLWFENRAAQRFQCGIVWLGTERTDVDRVVDTSGISNVA
jgi:hypothetical protein